MEHDDDDDDDEFVVIADIISTPTYCIYTIVCSVPIYYKQGNNNLKKPVYTPRM